MVDFITHVVGWKYTAVTTLSAMRSNRLWPGLTATRNRHTGGRGSVEELRESVAIDAKMHVLIAHGWDDLSCPFMASVLIVDQMPVMGDPERVQVKEYPGGHMFYSRRRARRC